MKSIKRDPHRCMKCSGTDIAVSHSPDVVDFKGLTIEVEGLAETVCKACGLNWITEGQEQDNLNQLRAAFVAKRDEVRRREGLLEGEQIEFVLSQLKLTKAEAAQLFGGGPNAFAKYIRGEVLQSAAMDRLLRLTLAFGTPALRVLERGAGAPLQRGWALTEPLLANTSSYTVNVPISAVNKSNAKLIPTASNQQIEANFVSV